MYFTDEGKEISRNKEAEKGGKGKIWWRSKFKNGEKRRESKSRNGIREIGYSKLS